MPTPEENRGSQSTCGPMFEEAFVIAEAEKDLWHEEAWTQRERALAMFSWGHMVGQAEKVYLGACEAFMVRPGPEMEAIVGTRIVIVCRIYGLHRRKLDTSRGVEFWSFKPPSLPSIVAMFKEKEDSMPWHHRRGILCGVPPAELDYKFHERYER